MGKNKHNKFLENLTFKCLVQCEVESILNTAHLLKGKWNSSHFSVAQPIVLELGCGEGDYTVAQARMCIDNNFIGVDIKGARLWRGAKTATEEHLSNASFLRTRIEFISSFFAPEEVSEIWITFPDPQLKKRRATKRLTSAVFLNLYRDFVVKDGIIHLKTDSLHLHEYTKALLLHNNIEPIVCNSDIYGIGYNDSRLSIQTTYEKKFVSEGLPITYLSWCIPDYLLEEIVFEADELYGDLDATRIKNNNNINL